MNRAENVEMDDGNIKRSWLTLIDRKRWSDVIRKNEGERSKDRGSTRPENVEI